MCCPFFQQTLNPTPLRDAPFRSVDMELRTSPTKAAIRADPVLKLCLLLCRRPTHYLPRSKQEVTIRTSDAFGASPRRRGGRRSEVLVVSARLSRFSTPRTPSSVASNTADSEERALENSAFGMFVITELDPYAQSHHGEEGLCLAKVAEQIPD